MQLRSTLILSGVFVVLTGWWFLYEKHYRPEKDKAQEAQKLLVQTHREDIFNIELVRNASDGKRETLSFTKSGEDWNMTSPVQDQADGANVSRIIADLLSTKPDRVVEENATDLKAYGLDSPSLSLTVTKAAGAEPLTVHIGSDAHVGAGSFVQVQGQKSVIRIGPALKTALSKDVSEYRNKSIAAIIRSDVSEIEITNKNGNFILQAVREKDKTDRWRLARDGAPADTNEVNNFLSNLSEFKATGIAANDTKGQAQYGFGKNEIRIVVTKVTDKSRIGLTLGRVKDDVYARRDGKDVIYKIDRLIWGRLEKSPEEYRARQMATFSRFDVRRIKIERAKDALELVKEDKDWAFVDDTKNKVNGIAVDTFLTRIQDAKVSHYGKESKAALGLDKPGLKITLFSKKDKEEKELVGLSFGSMRSKEYPVSRTDLDLAFFISESDYKILNAPKAEFLQLAPQDKAKDLPSLVPELPLTGPGTGAKDKSKG